METARLLFVHAHPDDETITTGATIAHYVARGAQVQVITCTLGEEGEVIGDEWAQLAVDRADQLGGYRIGELTAALAALGVDRPRYLGGAGRWRDSGMDGTPARPQLRFVDGHFAEQVRLLAEAIDELRPHVVVTYDEDGGYGHPDHIHTHRVTTAAVAASTWEVPKFYWTVTSATALADGLEAMGDVPEGWIKVSAHDRRGAGLRRTRTRPGRGAAGSRHTDQRRPGRTDVRVVEQPRAAGRHHRVLRARRGNRGPARRARLGDGPVGGPEPGLTAGRGG
jgi:N-acetyl-1-D-myo-inositol-2-amino-2-deoxy-alpha-D-glucopyranoside deacetylase